MYLSLKIISFPVDVSIEKNEFIYTNKEEWIGRGSHCWVKLEDPKNFISTQHAVIKKEGQEFVIEDRSTNGTVINSKFYKEGKKSTLVDGDILTIGEYKILCCLSDFTVVEQVEELLPRFLDSESSLMGDDNSVMNDHTLIELRPDPFLSPKKIEEKVNIMEEVAPLFANENYIGLFYDLEESNINVTKNNRYSLKFIEEQLDAVLKNKKKSYKEQVKNSNLFTLKRCFSYFYKRSISLDDILEDIKNDFIEKIKKEKV